MTRISAALRGRIFNHSCKSSIFNRILNVVRVDRHMARSSTNVVSCMYQQTIMECIFFFFLWRCVLNQHWSCIGVSWFSFNTHIPVLCFSLSIQQFLSILRMPSKTSWFATDASVIGIAESLISVDQPAQILSSHSAASLRSNLFPQSRRFARIDIPDRRREAAAM